MNMKNLAGNPVSIFLFRFVIHGDGISFVLNESIVEDMYEKQNLFQDAKKIADLLTQVMDRKT